MRSLRSRIVAAFAIIIFISSLLMVSGITLSTKMGYEDFAKENDILLAHRLADQLSEYYSINNSWTGVEQILPQPRMPMMMPRGRSNLPPVIITDSKGFVVLNTQHIDKTRINRDQLQFAVKIDLNDRIIGYIFVGNMIVKQLTIEEMRFLVRIRYIIIFIGIISLIISITFSYIFSRKLTKPLMTLTKASEEIKKGNYNTRVVTTGRDEIALLSDSFNSMAESIDKSDKWKKRLIADSAHELRTPVTLIQGHLEMILDGVYTADREHIQNIYNETLILTRLIAELQELSSAESGTMVLNMEEINLADLLNELVVSFNSGKYREKIELINRISSRSIPLQGDYHKLKQVFSNILSNAYSHTPEGGSITIDLKHEDNFIIISVTDTGRGIAEKDIEKIFERFYRTDDSRSRAQGGSGLGLAISREIVRLHNGVISARSTDGEGTTILTRLPL